MFVQKDIDDCISRVQLSRILSSLDLNFFSSIHTSKQDSSEWYAVDGKELRGSIDLNAKNTRGLSIVYALSHLTKKQQLLGYYDGTKKSKEEVIKGAIKEMPNTAIISLNAMHNSAGLLSDIEQNNRFYLTQIKANQKHLKEYLVHTSQHLITDDVLSEIDKSHGRIDQRDYEIYTIIQRCYIQDDQKAASVR
ncbi:hypothetical protein K5X82_08170 [Halosquirtibacter xylanolyticus]|uniref:hypothetical protein n=1 Tax=Halosquirtibacter xylanolyticus TaxID=3374599 RepID=UPI0037481828|nr:hypothetical protein K5X82_08170 [Prolixibacteraceae bacterium]